MKGRGQYIPHGYLWVDLIVLCILMLLCHFPIFDNKHMLFL